MKIFGPKIGPGDHWWNAFENVQPFLWFWGLPHHWYQRGRALLSAPQQPCWHPLHLPYKLQQDPIPCQLLLPLCFGWTIFLRIVTHPSEKVMTNIFPLENKFILGIFVINQDWKKTLQWWWSSSLSLLTLLMKKHRIGEEWRRAGVESEQQPANLT